MQETVNKVPKMKNTSSKKTIKVLSLLSAVLVTFILFSYYLVEGHGIFISLASSLLVALLAYGFVLICLQQLLGQNVKELKAPGSFTSNKNNRISLVNAPDDIESLKKLTDYVVLDTETTGLSPEKDQMVEIGIITVKNGEITNEYTSLIKPTIPISSEATAINGISESDLRDAPQLEDVIPDVVSRIKNQIVVGHNVTFDLAFVSRAISDHTEIASISYIDTVKVARNCIPGKSYRLQSLANRLCLDTGNAHRALDDAKTANNLLQYCIRKMTTDEKEFTHQERERKKSQKAAIAKEFAWSPIFDKNFAFTGDFFLDRDYLEGLLKDVGANLREKVNTKTVYLVVGDISHLPEWAVARKLGKANELIAEGQNITKLTESEYIALIEQTRTLKQKNRE